jgi:hypothetical protein
MEKKQVKLVGNSTGKGPFYEFFFLCGNSQSSEKQTQHHFTRWHSSSWNCSFHLRNMKTRWCAQPMVCLLSLACSYQFLSSYICTRFLTRCAQPVVCLLPCLFLPVFEFRHYLRLLTRCLRLISSFACISSYHFLCLYTSQCSILLILYEPEDVWRRMISFWSFRAFMLQTHSVKGLPEITCSSSMLLVIKVIIWHFVSNTH